MRETTFTLDRVRQLNGDTYELSLSGDASAVTAPGQFVNLELPGYFLRRPISICDWTASSLRLLVKEAGKGTRELVRLTPGTALRVLTGLGNGFAMDLAGSSPVLAGGGIGAAPLYGLARRLLEQGKAPTVALGFRSKADAYYLEEFAALGCPVAVATEDGSLGAKGFVTDCIAALPGCDYVCACGPLPMLKAVHGMPQLKGGQFSFEARMGCGFGACMGCTVPTAGGYKRVCKDGPILFQEEIVW